MSSVEWVEVRGKNIDVAVRAAIEELGLDGRDAADIEVLQDPVRGFLGIGGQDAVVRVSPKQQKSSRRRGGRGRGRSGSDRQDRNDRRGRSNRGGTGKSAAGDQNRQRDQSRQPRDGSQGERTRSQPEKTRHTRSERGQRDRKPEKESKVEVEANRTEQAEMVDEFLTGLLEAFGIEGAVDCRVEDDIIIADITGEQTEALIGPKGSILQATLELSRTIVQRKSQAGARIRLDIAGYIERRREALRIYTSRLVEKVVADGGEIMLEPMNAADRKVVHDAAADIGGVRTMSEGEEPGRSVVITKVDD